MQRRWIPVVGGIAAVAVALVAGQTLINRQQAASSTGTSESIASTGAVSATATAADRPKPRQPAPERLAPIAASGRARPGGQLHPLRTSPTGVISGLAADRLPAGSAYAMRFEPWGFGPTARSGRTVAVTVSSITPVGAAPPQPSLKGKRMLLIMDDTSGGVVYTGGLHTGVVTFLREGDVLAPTLSAVSALKP